MKFRIYWIIFTVLLLGFTAYVVLDTFIIERGIKTSEVYENSTDHTIAISDATGGSGATDDTDHTSDADDTEAETNKDGTKDETNSVDASTASPVIQTSIEISEETYLNTTLHIAYITFSDITELRTALANNTYGRNIKKKTSEIAQDVNAYFAINGDYYGARERGYVVRNGILYRSDSAGSKQQDLVLYRDGSATIINEGEITAEELMNSGDVWQVFSFGPGLVMNGEVLVSEGDEVDQAMSSNPRTSIGLIDAHHLLIVVSDGRTEESEGLSIFELASYMKNHGATVAYNLDGGGSSTMYCDGQIINYPTTDGDYHERRVSDIIYMLEPEQ